MREYMMAYIAPIFFIFNVLVIAYLGLDHARSKRNDEDPEE